MIQKNLQHPFEAVRSDSNVSQSMLGLHHHQLLGDDNNEDYEKQAEELVSMKYGACLKMKVLGRSKQKVKIKADIVCSKKFPNRGKVFRFTVRKPQFH